MREPAIFSIHSATEKGYHGAPKSSRLIDQPIGLFPFNQLTYDRIISKFETIERRFRTLQHSGNEEAKRLGDMAARINGLVGEFWSAVVEAEDRDRALEKRGISQAPENAHATKY